MFKNQVTITCELEKGFLVDGNLSRAIFDGKSFEFKGTTYSLDEPICTPDKLSGNGTVFITQHTTAVSNTSLAVSNTSLAVSNASLAVSNVLVIHESKLLKLPIPLVSNTDFVTFYDEEPMRINTLTQIPNGRVAVRRIWFKVIAGAITIERVHVFSFASKDNSPIDFAFVDNESVILRKTSRKNVIVSYDMADEILHEKTYDSDVMFVGTGAFTYVFAGKKCYVCRGIISTFLEIELEDVDLSQIQDLRVVQDGPHREISDPAGDYCITLESDHRVVLSRVIGGREIVVILF